MLKKIVLGTLLFGLVSVLAVGAITRTIDRQELVSGVSALGRGQGGGQQAADAGRRPTGCRRRDATGPRAGGRRTSC